MRRRGVVVFVACGACALALGGVLVGVGTAGSPGPPAAPGRAVASGSAASDPDSEAEWADSNVTRAIDPRLFSPGACLEFPPTRGDRDQTVFLDAGHGGLDPGGVGSTQAGASVLVGIYMDSGEPWNAGCLTGYDQDRPFSGDNRRLATLLQDDVLGAMNAQGWNIPDDGVQPDSGLGSALTAQAEAYGHLLLLGPAKAGYFETPSQMPGALIEPLFVTDPFEASIAASAHGQQVIASALAKAIEQYLTGS
jgi:hypothetical protein